MSRLAYYSSVGRQLSAADLAAAGLRRAYRAARRIAYRPGPIGSSLAVRPNASALQSAADEILRAPHRRGWSDVSRRADVLPVLARVPGAEERALVRAERAARREFDVFGTPVSFGVRGRIEWSLDPISGYRYPLAPSHSLRVDVPGVDPKYPWLLGRLDQLLALGQGYWAGAAGDRARFAAEFVDQTEDFILSNPAALGIHWTSPAEVALRAANLAAALLMFRDAPQVHRPGFAPLLLEALVEHGRFVEAHLEDGGAVPNNHLIANHVGLFVLGVALPELSPSDRWATVGARRIPELMQAQVHPDGYSFEGSTCYHRLTLEAFALAYLCASGGGFDLGEAFRERLRKMFAAAAAYCSEGGLAAQLGDNASARISPLRDRESLDHGYLAPLGAALLGEPTLKVRGSEFPDEAAWLLGRAGWEKFASLDGIEPPSSFASPKGGLYVLRGPGAVVSVSAGSQGQNGIGGHSHNDKLSFELHLDGIPVIVDVGTATYLRDRRLRDSFRATAAHNVVQLDGAEQAPLDPARPFALPSRVPTSLERLERSDRGATLVLAHGRSPGTLIRRTFVLDSAERALGVADQVTGGAPSNVVGRLHLRDSRVRVRPAQPVELSRAARACGSPVHYGGQAAEVGAPDAPLAVIVFAEDLSIEIAPAHYSSGYGLVQPAAMLVYTAHRRTVSVLTLVLLFGGGEPKIGSGKQAILQIPKRFSQE